LQQAQHHVTGALGAALVDHSVQRLDPFGGFLGVDIRQLARQAVADHRALAFGGHRRSFYVLATGLAASIAATGLGGLGLWLVVHGSWLTGAPSGHVGTW